MNELRLNSKSGTVPDSRLSSVSLDSRRKGPQRLVYLCDFQTVSAAKPLLLIKKITGTVLTGIGVFTLIATSLLCGFLLFPGPSFIDLLIDLTS